MTRPPALVFASSFGFSTSFYLMLSVVPLYATSVGAGQAGAGLATGALMLSTALAFDRHLEQEGFVREPEREPPRVVRVGYVRTSKKDQNPDLQRRVLEDFGCGRIFEEQISSRRANRPSYARPWTTVGKATNWSSGRSKGSPSGARWLKRPQRHRPGTFGGIRDG
jgi:hypothetical protein